MLEFRAALTPGPNDERPVQGFFTSMERAREWADLTLAKRKPGNTVTIYRITETPIELFTKTSDEKNPIVAEGIPRA